MLSNCVANAPTSPGFACAHSTSQMRLSYVLVRVMPWTGGMAVFMTSTGTAEACPRLVKLVLPRCSSVSDATLVAVGKHCHRLEMLDVSWYAIGALCPAQRSH